MSKFSETIENLRTQQKHILKDVARALGIPASRYRELEKGIRVPTNSQTARMEAYFGLAPGELAKLIE